MLRIPCPWCGVRDESEFRYRGDATRNRPGADAGLEAFSAYVYELKVVRHTLTHEIRSVQSAPGTAATESTR